VLVAYLVFTTVLGARLAGKQATIRDFFLAGRRIPWPAVAGSNIATEISAVTLISVPAVVYAVGGDLTYLQLSLGALLARLIVGIWFVRAFYEREIYSPYDYMGNWLGPQVRNVTSGLFILGAMLGQSVRVLITALVLEVISGVPLSVSIWLIGAAAVVWTLLGGITTVIWTDVIQFFIFLISMLVALVAVVLELPGGWPDLWHAAADAGKLRLWNLSTSPHDAFTLWAGLIGNTILCLAVYGTDQTMAQRMFCCRGRRQATLAVIASSAGLIVPVLAVFVGLGLFAFYQHHPLTGDALAAVQKHNDRIFPVFILQQMPVGVVGLIIAGVFAAAISTLDGVLVALSQVVISVYRPWREATIGAAGGADDPHYVRVSKVLVVVWGVLLCLMAQISKLAWDRYNDILDLALAMATYTSGSLLAAFLLAFFRMNVDYRGILWAAPLSILAVFAITWHQPWAQYMTIGLAAAILAGWCWHVLAGSGGRTNGRHWDGLATAGVVLAGGLAIGLCCLQFGGKHITVAWPWNVPLGFVVALVFGYLLARPRAIAAPIATSATANGLKRIC
jgi:solute:Na+ symporter, SSS family